MKKIITLTSVALMLIAAMSATAQELVEVQLESPAKAENMYAYYKTSAPDASWQEFLQDNAHLGHITPSTELPLGTIWYVVALARN